MGTYRWANALNTNGYNGYWPNPGVKTDAIGMPTFRLSRNGRRPFFVGGIRWMYASGPGSIWNGIYYQPPGFGVVETGGNYLFPESGGQFTYFIRGSAGTLRFGRDEPAGRTVQSENEAFAWGGTLAGEFDWAEVPTNPQAFDAHLAADATITFSAVGSADNGNSAISAYIREMRVNGGAWGSQTSDWSSPVAGVRGNTYQFRLFARNGVGDSTDTVDEAFTIPYSGGRRMTAGDPSPASKPLSISRRFNGDVWKDLTIRKRHNGSAFVDITN